LDAEGKQARTTDAAAGAPALLLQALEQVGDAVALFDADDRLATCNRAYRELLPDGAGAIVPGTSCEAILRAFAAGTLAPAPPAAMEAWIAQRLARHRAADGPSELRLGDGRWLRCETRRTPAGGRLVMLTDIGELKRRRQEPEARGRLTGGIAHDLNSVLMLLLGYLEMLEERLGTDDAESRGLLERARAAVARGTGLAGRLAALARRSDGGPETEATPAHGNPVRPPRAGAAPAPDGAAPDAPPLQRGTALLVEDDAPVRDMMAAHLAAMGFHVEAHACAGPALDLLEGERPVELLVTDLALGGPLDGTDVADAAAALRPQLPVLLVSGNPLRPAGLPGTAELLAKPFTRASLSAAVARAMHGVRRG